METLFENRFYARYTMMREYFRKYGTGPRLPVIIVTALVWVVIAAFCAMIDIMEEMKGPLFLVAVLDITLFFLPYLTAWVSLRNGKKLNNGVLPETIVTFGEKIELHEGMIHITVEYEKIVRVVRLKHSYMLMLGKRNGLILDPNGFTKGSFEEFKQFIRRKRPDLAVPE